MSVGIARMATMPRRGSARPVHRTCAEISARIERCPWLNRYSLKLEPLKAHVSPTSSRPRPDDVIASLRLLPLLLGELSVVVGWIELGAIAAPGGVLDHAIDLAQ